jgi:phosphatidylethanolamine/phosphatidyl-N-methylethanolamine N-methyltransferase
MLPLGVDGKFYDETYKAMFYDQGKATLATKFLHKSLERHPNKAKHAFPITLEIGGGEGLHFKYVKSKFQKYLLTDIRSSELSPEAKQAMTDGRLVFSIENAEELSIEDSFTDRTIFACVLHHLLNPEKALMESRRVTKPGGMISIYLPCDPGLVYRFLRKVFTRKVSKKLKIDYELENVREHINHYYQLEKLIYEVFKNDVKKVKKFPVPLFSYDFNIFTVLHITKSEL